MSIKCDDCGRPMRSARIAKYDFTSSAGLGARVLLKNVPGLRCANGHETLTGEVVNRALFQLGVVLLELPTRLPAGAARYLRRVFGLTQEQLATRMGVVRETVAQWETGRQPISAQNDMILRTLAVKSLLARGLLKPSSVPDLIPEHVASDPPKPLRAPVILSGLSEAA